MIDRPMLLKKTLYFLLLLFCTASLWAVPAKRTVRVVEQPDGTQLALTMRGDEHFHCLVTTDGVPVVCHEGGYYYALFGEEGLEASALLAHEPAQRSAGEQAFVEGLSAEDNAAGYTAKARGRRSAAASRVAEVPTTGEVYVPVLLVQYKDVKFSSDDPKTAFEERVNGDNYTAEGGCGSIREYFVEQSGGQFTPRFDIIGPVTLDENMEYYGANDKIGNDQRPREMVIDACKKVYSARLADFKRYDNNGDGYVDILYVIYAGYGEASYPDMLENTIWPHQWQLETPQTFNGVRISRYACNNELDGYKGTTLDGIGTFCHEFSHCLGLPDFYDTSAEGKAFGMSLWSIMDQGCYNNDGHTPCGYSAYEKDCLGWKPLVELRNPAQVTLSPLGEGGTGYKIVNEANPDEFYVVEYRDKSGWDKYIPAEGMLVTHVDYLSSAWYENIVNNDPDHQRVTIIPADGKLTAQTLGGDTYPGLSGNTSLTATSKPAAKVYVGGTMGKDITDIASVDGAVTFNFMQGALPAPQLHAPEVVSPSAFTLTWEPVEAAEAYDVRLDLIGDDSLEYILRTVRVEECRYTFSGLDGGLYRCRVRSVSGGINSYYSEPVLVQLTDSLLPSTGDAPRIHISNDSITIEAADSADIYYTLDGSYPTAYSLRYTAPFRTTDKVSVRAIARREGHRSTPVAQLDNWFAQGGATYRVTSTAPLRAVVAEAAGGNGDEDYCGHYIFGDTVQHGSAVYTLDGFDAAAFRYATALRSVTVEGRSMQTVGDSLFHGCVALNAVVWDAPLALPHNVFDEDSYRNLLVYLPDTMEAPASLTRCAYATLIRDGYSGPLTLDATSAFYCPRSFTAESVTYRRTFRQTTGLGTSGGWETLALPFDVQRIAHATKGDIVPFGVEGEHHCWLSTPREGAFAPATEIRANTPYIIAMPNNEAYGTQSLAGSITFSAEEALIHATPFADEAVAQGLPAADGQHKVTTVSLALLTTYDPIEASAKVYALNVGSKYGEYAPGSVFAAGRYDVAPFSVYMMVIGVEEGAPFYPIPMTPDGSSEEEQADDAGTPQSLTVKSRGGCLYITAPEERVVCLYDAVGRLLRAVVCVAGTTEVGPLDEGLYIIERTKVYVER